MDQDVKIIDAAPTLLAAIRTASIQEDLGRTIIASLDHVYAFLKTQPTLQRGFNVVVYLDGLNRIDVGVQVSAAFEGGGPVRCSGTPSGPAATTTHWGPYAELQQAHDAARQWCVENHKALAGPVWEVYGHWDDDPRKLRTDVYYLLRKT